MHIQYICPWSSQKKIHGFPRVFIFQQAPSPGPSFGASFLQVLPAVRRQRAARHVAALQGRQGGDALGEVHGGQGAQDTGELLGLGIWWECVF